MNENNLISTNILYAKGIPKDTEWLKFFCGEVIYNLIELSTKSHAKVVYLTGDLKNEFFVGLNCKIFIVKEYSSNYDRALTLGSVKLIGKGEIPLN